MDGNNMDFAGKNPRTDSLKNNNFGQSEDISSFENINEFGRESLGIFNLSHLELDKNSLGMLHDELGRESLGIVNLTNLDIGRESLGITNIQTYDFMVANVNLPVVQTNKKNVNNSDNLKSESNQSLIPSIETCDQTTDKSELVFKVNDNSINSILNTGFLKLPKTSLGSSVSSICPSFNSASLESIPSRIFSVSMNSHTNLWNEAFEDTSNFIKRFQLTVKSPSSVSATNTETNALNLFHRRINSLPTALEEKNFKCFNSLNLDNKIDKMLGPKQVISQEEQEVVDLIEAVDIDDEFKDSVFIEGKHIASRIADGSFLEADNDMLDSITEPEDFANVSEIEGDPTKCDKEEIFRAVDKMFLPFSVDQNVPNNMNSTSAGSLNPSSKNSDNSENFGSTNNSKSKNALEIISSLSEILNTNPSEKHKCEGQTLLTSLAEIFLSSTSTKSRSSVLDDSGHSSIESEPIIASDIGECYEVLDLRKKSSSETNINQIESEGNCLPLDLSLKSKSTREKSFTSPKILPQKCTRNSRKSLITSINKSVGSYGSDSSNGSKNLSGVSKKFRPKQTHEKISNLRKGPMKAILPVDNMARKNSEAGGPKITPTRIESKLTNYKLKKTSTPIHESNIKPMAQSTPDNPKTTCLTSPLARPSSSVNSSPKKLNYSRTKLPVHQSVDSKCKTNSSFKRNSTGELRNIPNTRKPFTRSYSMGGKSQLGSIQRDNIKQNVSPFNTETNKLVLKENRPKSRSLTRSSLTKKAGKENRQ